MADARWQAASDMSGKPIPGARWVIVSFESAVAERASIFQSYLLAAISEQADGCYVHHRGRGQDRIAGYPFGHNYIGHDYTGHTYVGHN